VSDIFISYARPDRAKAQMLAKALEELGWSVWWDPKIRPGKTFHAVINRALEAAKCVIVLWSRKSVQSNWVIEEATEGKERSILVPALIEDNIKIPLGFRQLHASRLTDWQGEPSHLEFDELKEAVKDLLGGSLNVSPGKGGASVIKGGRKAPWLADFLKVPEGVYLDPETKLMWTIKDNGHDIDWHEANKYARQLRLGGYSDWRLPTIEELKQLHDPNRGELEYEIRKPFQLTSLFVWSSTREGSDSAWGFGFIIDGRRGSSLMVNSDGPRALCVRRSGDDVGHWVI
jgi:TIR domain/Protein of unknown function (DUF1566)